MQTHACCARRMHDCASARQRARMDPKIEGQHALRSYLGSSRISRKVISAILAHRSESRSVMGFGELSQEFCAESRAASALHGQRPANEVYQQCMAILVENV